jgi:secreted trypsin-like serine protease
MKISAALFPLLVATLTTSTHAKPLIMGGSVVPVAEKTYTVGLRYSAAGDSFCGGSLITPSHVLTAAHCLGMAKYVSVGSHYRKGSTDGERVAIKNETRHPSYDAETSSFDYGIIELQTPVTSYAPIKMLTTDPYTLAGSIATVMGWGATLFSGPKSKDLLRVDVPILTEAACENSVLKGQLTPSMFCAGGEADKDACGEDSGGPMIVEQPMDDVLVGVVSWGFQCGVKGKPSVYSKVSAVQSWIQELAPTATFVDSLDIEPRV